LAQPVGGEGLHQGCERYLWGMPCVQDAFDNVGSQKRQSEDAATVGRVNFLYRSELFDSPICAGLQEFAPPEGAGKRFDHGIVDARPDLVK
jgi:hypothetical protein